MHGDGSVLALARVYRQPRGQATRADRGQPEGFDPSFVFSAITVSYLYL